MRLRRIKSAASRWLRDHHWVFSDHRWYREWHGGNWSFWYLGISCGPVWVPEWKRPGCGLICLAVEDHGSKKDDHGSGSY